MGENGVAKIENNKLIVKNPTGNGKCATIVLRGKGKLIVNGIEKKNPTTVKEEDNVEFFLEEQDLVREIDLRFAEKDMKAFITIQYAANIKYVLKDTEESHSLQIDVVEEVVKEPELFTEEEILAKLKNEGITVGILSHVIKDISTRRDVKDILVACGLEPKDAVDDSTEFLVNKSTDLSKANTMQAIDYKNINKINSVNEGDVFAVITPGREAIKGKNIFGDFVNSKKNRRKTITSGKGCKIVSNNAIATISGQISFKNGVVGINKVYQHLKDVDIVSGNINFQGDVNVNGNVTEGMMVCAMSNINITGGAYRANVIAMGDINIKGNIMTSKVVAGGNNVNKQQRIDYLLNLEEILEKLINTVIYLKDNNIIQTSQGMGSVVKSLIETKFKDINKICTDILTATLKDKDTESKVLEFMKSYLMGAGPLRVQRISDLTNGIDLIREERRYIEDDSVVVSNIFINNCQDGMIQASGDIYIEGKGVFTTDMVALNSIIFRSGVSVCRGGHITAKNYIKAGVVGSIAGGQTTLEVQNKEGKIEIDTAYNNTIIIINNKKYIVENPIRNVKCFIDKDGELAVEKFML